MSAWLPSTWPHQDQTITLTVGLSARYVRVAEDHAVRLGFPRSLAPENGVSRKSSAPPLPPELKAKRSSA